MKMIDRQYLSTPFYGARKMAAWLQSRSQRVNRKRAQRLMRVMGLRAVYRRPRTTIPAPTHRRFPYLLRGMNISAPNQVWATDITFIPMARGFLYLVAIMDWYSRYVIAWRLSNTLDTGFCLDALSEALGTRKPEIFNSDQGSQFSSNEFTGMLERHDISISMDGKGSYNDNLFIERLWRTVKYEEVYLKAYQDGREAKTALADYFRFYNNERPHQSLGYRTPAAVYNPNRMDKPQVSLIVSKEAPRMAEPHLNLAPTLS